jgi:hypothetical protein
MTLNATIAAKLRDMADALQVQDANPFRINAYRHAAETMEHLAEPADSIVRREGREGLAALPGIGEGIASAIVEICATGRWSQLERVTGALDPESLFQSLPGIGPRIAARLHEDLDVDTLEHLEAAAHDGRLERVKGVGRRRAAAIRAMLADRMGRRRLSPSLSLRRPSVPILLEIDARYRAKAKAGLLRMIAPARFNPKHAAWLPIMHDVYDGWRFTVLFSNTARAHELAKINDWVVIYFASDGSIEGRCTIVTETRGRDAGRRVVRGREEECAAYYAGQRRPRRPGEAA